MTDNLLANEPWLQIQFITAIRIEMNDPVIALHQLSKNYGDVHAVRDLSLTIEAGTIFGFLGPNGAGKTTTLRMVWGLTHSPAGPGRIDGRDARKARHCVAH